MTVTKKAMVKRIAAETEVKRADVKEVVQHFLDDMVEALSEGKKIEFRRFGIFELVVAKEKVGRNPKKPQNEVVIPEHVKVRFRTSESLTKKVSQLAPKDFK
jgi:nucleoid DNA-binding protein